MLLRLALFAPIAFALAAGHARANVTYVLSQETFSDDSGSPGAQPLVVSLTVSDAAVAQGTFNLIGQPHFNGYSTPDNPIAFSGDLADFVSFSTNSDGVTPTYLYGNISLGFTFNPETAAVTSSRIHFFGLNSELEIGGTGSLVSGTYGLDQNNCSAVGGSECHVSAVWSVPEPGTFGTLLLGLSAAIPLAPQARRRFQTDHLDGIGR